MQNNAFQPFGPTVLVGAANPVQAPTTNGTQATSYRCVNVSSAAIYLSWSPAIASAQAPNMGSQAPTATQVSPNTVRLVAASMEVLVLPANSWFLASAPSVEVTPGEGI